ncbi:small auxin-up RNA [Artemisia annua]|uniref:Small auxin-up RNA n=1 Tax=Artemisia annua TaxID=35608 RepID=A0A2U1KD95_ARTAN|nr:small auxin-up RNA [Artemisia annua]
MRTINIRPEVETSIKVLNLPIHIDFPIDPDFFLGLQKHGCFPFSALVSNAKQTNQTGTAKQSSRLPKGTWPVIWVEKSKVWFLYLTYDNPCSKELLRSIRGGKDFGFNHRLGGLTIPCREEAFVHLLTNCTFIIEGDENIRWTKASHGQGMVSPPSDVNPKSPLISGATLGNRVDPIR